MSLDPTGSEFVYRKRFGGRAERRQDVWRVLCRNFFQRWVPETATVLDIAAGYCEFSNNIRAARRIALDFNPTLPSFADDGVEAIVGRADDMHAVADGSVDVAFVSNFFEHIDRSTILQTLRETRRVLKPGGRLLILQPNVRYCAKNYWQFFDHITPVDDRALCEALTVVGFTVQTCVPRFLPYTTKSKLPARTTLVALYLRVPPAWRIFGAQAFIVAVAPEEPGEPQG